MSDGRYSAGNFLDTDFIGQGRMEPFSERTHAFYLRFWLEPRDLADSSPEWRGVVEHLNNGEKRYFTDLHEITEFLMPFLAEWNVQIKLPRSRRRRLSRLGACLRKRK